MKPDQKIRILIADDHCIVRIGLAAVVDTQPDMEIVAEASDGAQAIQMFEERKPDLILMDSRMAGMTGIEATIEIRKRSPHARVLMLTAFDGDADIRKALEAGAQGYVLKSTTAEQLIPALRTVASGGSWFPGEVARRLSSHNSYEALTSREQDVLNELAKGLANKQIADQLRISEHTVKAHIKTILGKLRVADRTEALRVAIQRGIVQI